MRIATLQRLLREDQNHSELAVMYGASTHNQRIERFWSYLRTVLLRDYSELFQEYVNGQILDTSDPLQMECLTFAFLPAIQAELRQHMLNWNSHRVRTVRTCRVPGGVPDYMFEFPHGAFSDQSFPLHLDKLTQNQAVYQVPVATSTLNDSFHEWATIIMARNGLSVPTSMQEAIDLFELFIKKVVAL